MHEVATHADHNLEDSRPNTQAEGLRETGQAELLTPAHISALTTCLTSIHGIFDTFLALPTETVRNLPVFHFVRVAYACVLLIRMYYAATTADAEFGKVISKEDLRVEYYLDNLLEVFRAAAEHEKSRPAQKFLMLIVMLKTWFQRQRDGKCRVLKDAFCAKVGQHLGGNLSLGSFHMDVRPTETTREKTTPRLGYQQSHPNEDTNGHTPRKAAGEQNIHRELSGNTPLHLLSEVAMGNSAATPGGPGTSTGEWWYGHSSTNSGTASVGIHNPSAPPSETVMAGENDINLDAAISDGFEQAMSMTLGEGDLSSLFLGDGFFDLNLDGTPNGFQSLG